MSIHQELISEIQTQLAEHGNADFAVSQQRYLKTTEALLGVRVPVQRKLLKQITYQYAPGGLSQPDLLDTARELWDLATYREHRRAAIMLLLLPQHAAMLDSSAMEVIEHFVRTGASWDLVDECVHTHNHIRRNEASANFHQEFQRMVSWANDPDIWIRRFAILCQLQAKEHTNVQLLTAVIEPNLLDQEFFIAKAVGWALRDYARTNPRWVREFIAAHPMMQPLSRREASKHL